MVGCWCSQYPQLMMLLVMFSLCVKNITSPSLIMNNCCRMLQVLTKCFSNNRNTFQPPVLAVSSPFCWFTMFTPYRNERHSMAWLLNRNQILGCSQQWWGWSRSLRISTGVTESRSVPSEHHPDSFCDKI